MRKISFWLTTLANVMMLILVIIGIVKVSKEFGFDIGEYTAYQGNSIWGSVWFGITVAIMAIATIILVVDYFIEADTLKRVLMIISLALPVVLFGAMVVLMILKQNFAMSVLALIMLASCLWPVINLIVSEKHRAKFIYIIFSTAWVLLGIWLIVGIAGLLIIGAIISIVGFIAFGGDAGKDVYDKFGNFVGRIYED